MSFNQRIQWIADTINASPEARIIMGWDPLPLANQPERPVLEYFKQGTPLQRVAALIVEAEADGIMDVKRRTSIINEFNHGKKHSERVANRDSINAEIGRIRGILKIAPSKKPSKAK